MTELEPRTVLSMYTVALLSPPAGVQGYSECRVLAGRLMVRPALDPDGDGQVTVTASDPTEAVRKAVVGKVLVDTRAVGLPRSVYAFSERTSRTSKAVARDARVPFVVTDGLIALEDLARFPGRSDWDFNDTFWKVRVTEAKTVAGWSGFQEGPQSPPRPGQPTPPEAHWTRTSDVLRTPEGDLADPVLRGSLTQEGPRYETMENFQAFRMTVEYRGLDTTPIAPAPNGKRLPESNQHLSNSGVYIYDRYEVQIIDPSQFRLPGGAVGVSTDAELTDAVVNEAYANNASFYVPGGLYGVSIPSPDGHYWNRARPTGEWNDLEIDFTPAVLRDLDPRDPSLGQDPKVAVAPARITVRLNDRIVLDDVEIKNAVGPLTGTGSRGRASDFLVSGPVKLQSHWGSQVEFRNVVIEAISGAAQTTPGGAV